MNFPSVRQEKMNRITRRQTAALLMLCAVVPLFCSCSYMGHAVRQAEYALTQRVRPRQKNLKHMITRPTVAVIGKTTDPEKQFEDVDLAIAAYSSRYSPNERVDTMHLTRAGTHFGLHLPEGDFQILTLADINRNGIYDADEVVAARDIVLTPDNAPDQVLEGLEICLTSPVSNALVQPFAVPEQDELQPSLFYPAGTIRKLSDPIFDPHQSMIGMYEPAAFLERCPTLFYALEEDMGHKIPIIFVHGVDGSPRNFGAFVKSLDRTRYKPLFFYYPSGEDLDQMADMFYRIFLSGKIARFGKMPMIIVAHSMGGLVVREALNRYTAADTENRVELFVTLATPFGGHPSAALGEKYSPIVLPSWKDVNPDGPFISNLYRKPIPPEIRHALLYAYHNPSAVKLSENSDGVIPLASQLDPRAQEQANEQFGINSDHTGILISEDAIQFVYKQADTVSNILPKDHLAFLNKGGVNDFPGIDGFQPTTRHVVETSLWYLLALADGTLAPALPEQHHFLLALQGKTDPETDIERDLIRFLNHVQTLKESAPATLPPEP